MSETDFPASIRALQLIRLVANKPGELSISDVAAQLNLAKSTVHRLVDHLLSAGFLHRDVDRRFLWVGHELREFALNVIRNDISRAIFRDALTRLSNEVSETCNIAALEGTEIIYLERVEARWPLRLSLDLGSRIPVHCCASGKLFLALLPEKDRNRILRSLRLDPITPRTITNQAGLDESAREIRRSGYSLDREEFVTGMVAIAYPICNLAGDIRVSLSIHGPTIRCPRAEDLVRWAPLLKSCAQEIESQMFGLNTSAPVK